MAIQTAHLRDAWIEGEDQPPDTFLPKFPCDEEDPIPETTEDVIARERREASQFA